MRPRGEHAPSHASQCQKPEDAETYLVCIGVLGQFCKATLSNLLRFEEIAVTEDKYIMGEELDACELLDRHAQKLASADPCRYTGCHHKPL